MSLMDLEGLCWMVAVITATVLVSNDIRATLRRQRIRRQVRRFFKKFPPPTDLWQKRNDPLPNIPDDAIPPMPKCKPPMQECCVEVGFRRARLIDGKLTVIGEAVKPTDLVVITAEDYKKVNNGGIRIR